MKVSILHILLFAVLMCPGLALHAQAGQTQPDGTFTEEVSVAGEEEMVDSTILGMDIFSAIPESVVVRQEARIRLALGDKIMSDESVMTNGFRIRIFIDSRRNARETSLEVLRRFNERYPFIQVYRSYSAPNFKVTVGNFRNRVEAEKLLAEIKGDYPDAFIVRERFKYPSIGDADTRSREDLLEDTPSGQMFTGDMK